MLKNLKSQKLTESIIKVDYNNYNQLGYGFLEKIYENAMMIDRKSEGFQAVAQSPIKVLYNGKMVGEYFADILVEGEVIVEIKATKKLVAEHDTQLLNYLKATTIEMGFC